MRAQALALSALLFLCPVSIAQNDAPDASKIIASIESHYSSLDGCLVSMNRVMVAPDAPFTLPAGGHGYGTLIVKPNRVRAWEIADDRGGMTMKPGIDSFGEELVQGFGAPMNIYESGAVPADFATLIEQSKTEEGKRPTSVLPMMPGLVETLSLFTEEGFAVNGLSLTDLEYAGIEGEDLDLTHVFRGEAEPRNPGDDPQQVEVHFNAVGDPWLMKIITDSQMRVMMGGQGESSFSAIMTNTFSDWRGIPKLDQTEGREQVDNLGEAMESRMKSMGGPGNN